MHRLLLIVALVLGASVAQAENGTFYFGAGASSNELKDIGGQGSTVPDLNGPSWKLFAGFRPIRAVALEAEYLDLGSRTVVVQGACSFCCMQVCRGTETSDSQAQAFTVSALGFLPIPVPYLDVYGKAGIARWKLNGNGLESAPFTDRGTSLAWGVGLQAHISVVGVRLEYEGFSVSNSSGAKVASISIYALL